MTKILCWNIEKFRGERIDNLQLAWRRSKLFDELRKLECTVEQPAQAYVSSLWEVVTNNFGFGSLALAPKEVNTTMLKTEVANILKYCGNFKSPASECLTSNQLSASHFIQAKTFEVVKKWQLSNPERATVSDYLKHVLLRCGQVVSAPGEPPDKEGLALDDRRNLFRLLSGIIDKYVDKHVDAVEKNDLPPKIDQPFKDFTEAQARKISRILPKNSNLVLSSILTTIKAASPDVFVLIEVMSSNVGRYKLLNALGVVKLLHLLRGLSGSYCMVPPVRIGGTNDDFEGIAVYYKSDMLEFQGPWVWTDTGPQSPSANPKAADYPSPYSIALPSASAQKAAQVKFLSAADEELDFGPSANNPGRALWRTPVLTQFKEIAAPQRTLNILAVHNQWLKIREDRYENTRGIDRLSEIHEMTTDIHDAGNVGIIIGDFNANGASDKLFEKLHNQHYMQLLKKEFIQTYIKKNVVNASLVGAFPTYSYCGTGHGNADGALDNALVKNAATEPKAYVINRFTGSDLTAAGAPKFGYGASFLKRGSLVSSIPQSSIDDAINNTKDLTKTSAGSKKEIVNTLKAILSVSDHFPILIEV